MTFVRDPLDGNDNKENPSETKNVLKRINIIDNILKDLNNKLTHSEETLFDDFSDMFKTAKDDISKLKKTTSGIVDGSKKPARYFEIYRSASGQKIERGNQQL